MTEPFPLAAIHGDSTLSYGGYVVLTRGIGADPNDRNGENFRRFEQVPIVRLNYSYYPNGTIPQPPFYADFAQRVANYVEMSPGCTRWIIGNEPNHEQEWPNGRPITPTDYATCYNQCRVAIHALQGHESDEVLVAAVAPWNVQTKYPGNESGDWIRYFEDVQRLVSGCDGFALHTYARAQTSASINDTTRMDPPFEFYFNGFQTYRDWMGAILPAYRGLPVYLTEFCIAGEPWADADTGCILAAYAEIDWWNLVHSDQPIHCLTVYRWQYDQWAIDDKPQVHQDFYNAVDVGYSWPQEAEPPEEDDMLQNRSLEGPYNQDSTHSTVKVAHDWGWFASSGAPPAESSQGPCMLPEYKPLHKTQDPRRVWDGNTAQCWFIRWKVFDAGIYQTADAVPGASYQFDAMAQAWCSNSDDPTVSDGEMYISLGIDPQGGTDAFGPGVAWSEWDWVGADYKRYLSPIVLAGGNRVTVFVRAWNKWKLSHNDIYIDDTHLVKVEDEPPPGGGECLMDWGRLEETVRRVVREEIDRTIWASGAG